MIITFRENFGNRFAKLEVIICRGFCGGALDPREVNKISAEKQWKPRA